jgi:RNA polymerase sigma-70 factor (ECF subfamily)
MNPAGKLLEIILPAPLSGDGEVLERFRKGDSGAFAVIYGTYSPSVFRFSFHMTGDRTTAAEITQDVFVWLFQHASGFDPNRGELAPFLIGVARQLIRQHDRAERRWIPLQQAAHSQPVEIPDPSRRIDAEALRNAVATLPFRYREPVILCDLEGHSYEEAALLLKCAVGTIRSRLNRAHELLARKLGLRKNS